MMKQYLLGNEIDFEKKCKLRIWAGAGFVLLGTLALIALSFYRFHVPVLYLEEGHQDFVGGFYCGTGFALIASGLITILKNRRYLKKADLQKKRKVYEQDERNRMIGLRSWAYAGYSMFLLLYLSILVSGFISMTILKVLLVVLAVFGLLLFCFSLILRKLM